MSELEEPVTTVVDGWTIVEHAYDGVPYAEANAPSRGFGCVESVEFNGEKLEVWLDAPYDGRMTVDVPMSVVVALASIHARRLGS